MVSKEQAAISASRKPLSASRNAWILQKEESARGQQAKVEGKPVGAYLPSLHCRLLTAHP